MKHEITSMNTKKALGESLKKLMRIKPFSKITISEIINDCGVNRKTFYYHFEDIYALLKWIFEQEAIEVVAHFDLAVDYGEAITFVMDYVEKNDYMISCAYDSMGRDEMKNFFYTDFIGIMSKCIDSFDRTYAHKFEEEYKHFLACFYTEAFSGMLIEWTKSKEREREKTKEYLLRIIQASIRNIMLEM